MLNLGLPTKFVIMVVNKLIMVVPEMSLYLY